MLLAIRKLFFNRFQPSKLNFFTSLPAYFLSKILIIKSVYNTAAKIIQQTAKNKHDYLLI
jgi:hypothetical protein